MLKSIISKKYIIAYAVRTINTSDILIDRHSIYKTMGDIEHNRTSRSKGPLSVFHLISGENKGRYLLEDGFHRLFILLLKHQTRVKVNIIGAGSSSGTDLATPIKPFKIDPNLKYMGLEDLADEDILDELANIHKG